MIATNCNYKTKFIRLEKEKIDNIIKENKIANHIDEVLEHLIVEAK